MTIDGLRIQKTNPDGSYIKYHLMNGRYLGETHYNAQNQPQKYIRYTYDENNTICGIGIKNSANEAWTEYYFETNLQGDIIAVYTAENGTNGLPELVASYTYDAWGNILSSTGELANLNPFRYRGYYYDTETQFYYLQSRYYNPEIGRFINADTFTTTGQGIIGQNMFAYCGNNPIIRKDVSGEFWGAIVRAAVGAVVGAVVSAAVETVKQVAERVVKGKPIDWGSVGTKAASGAVYGGVIAATGSVSAASMASTATESVINGVRAGDNILEIATDTTVDVLGTAAFGRMTKVINKSLSGKYLKLNRLQQMIKKYTDAPYVGKYSKGSNHLATALENITREGLKDLISNTSRLVFD